MYAFSSILAALYRRQATGEGAAISLSMLECLTEWTAVPIYSAAATGVVPERAGHRHALIAPYGLYALSDGARVLVAVQSNRDWATFASEVLCDGSLVTDPRFVDNQDRIDNVIALEAIIAATFGAVSADEIVGRLSDSGVVWARARSPLEVWDHEQLAARDRFMSVEVEHGSVATFKPPFNISGCPDPAAQVPALGAHDPALVERLLARSTPTSSERDGASPVDGGAR
jgi:crotonobetainyl-CoA:carnitine CoA-transferase CaiB-like acyl-CoA transferase